MSARLYYVEHRVSMVVTEQVMAETASEAITLCRDEHIGEAIGAEIDETRFPTTWKARPAHFGATS